MVSTPLSWASSGKIRGSRPVFWSSLKNGGSVQIEATNKAVKHTGTLKITKSIKDVVKDDVDKKEQKFKFKFKVTVSKVKDVDVIEDVEKNVDVIFNFIIYFCY